jgi:hypothetical protein
VLTKPQTAHPLARMIYTVPYSETEERVDVRLAIDGMYRPTSTAFATTYAAEEIPVADETGYRQVRRYRRTGGAAATLGAVSSTLVDEGVDPELAHVHRQRFRYLIRSLEGNRDLAGRARPSVPAVLLAMARAHPPQ